jgi:phospholipid-binding lipoprotein MlaA
MLVKEMNGYVRLMVLVLGLAGLQLAGGCSTVPKQKGTWEPPLHTAQGTLKDSVVYPVEVYDPLEGFNRRVYRFNYYFDKFLYLPVMKTYEFITPNYVETRVSRFFKNAFEIGNLSNNLLQLKFKRSGVTLSRFLINTTVGVAGLWDPATTWGLHRQNEDFGQTLAHYGVGNGPFVVLPILGPSNLRDATGTLGDWTLFYFTGPRAYIDDYTWNSVFNGMAAVDKRHSESFRYYRTGSPFEYDMIRMLYTTKREMEVAK